MMSARRILWVPGILLVAAALGGCGKSKSDAISQKQFLGTWVQDFSKSRGVIVEGGHKARHELTINGDGTFKIVMTDLEGKPLDPPQFAEGRWDLKNDPGSKGQMIAFETTVRNLKEPYDKDSPYRAFGLALQAKGATRDELEVMTEASIRMSYMRTAAK